MNYSMCGSWRGLWCLTTCSSIILLLLYSKIYLGDFQYVYNHWPQNCTIYTVNGSEDVALFPNNVAIISSGLFHREIEDPDNRPVPKLLLFDFERVGDGLLELELDIDWDQFNPHGVGHWITTDGDHILYVISHQEHRDTVESFLFIVEEKRLKHRATFQHPLLCQLNDIVVVSLDEFYVTVDHYFSHVTLKTIESLLQLPLSTVVYHKSGNVRIVAAGLSYANGIARSNNLRFIYVSNIGSREVFVYKRDKDGSLYYIQNIKIRYVVDNIFIDPSNGHMWVAVFPRPLNVLTYIVDHTYPVEGRVFHISLYEESSMPFSYDNSRIEEMFETDGRDFGAVTVAVQSEDKMLLGTIARNLMICENVKPSF